MSAVEEFLANVERRRSEISARLEPRARAARGQFFTPRASAGLVASLAPLPAADGWKLIDAGAGVGSLAAALVARWLLETDRPTMSVLAYEIDPNLVEPLEATLAEARALAKGVGRWLETTVSEDNFILNPPRAGVGNILLMNPPYRKLGVKSAERAALESGADPVRVTNLYAAFLICAVRALASDDGLVAITPRSFANGPYFRDLRSELLARASFRHIHIFEARDRVFADSAVLQESLIFSMSVGAPPADITISSSTGPEDEPDTVTRRHDQVVHAGDRQRFIRLPLNEESISVTEHMAAMPCTLSDLGIKVSTGRLVDFRAKAQLRARPGEGAVPLIYPQNLRAGRVEWPVATHKPQALRITANTAKRVLPNEHYVLVKRFSSKEEPRRVVAALATPAAFGQAEAVAHENHLNVFHASNRGLDPAAAVGLAAYLNSRLVDQYVRQFSGHTQINATDLRELRYPTTAQLHALGRAAAELSNPVDPEALDLLLCEIGRNRKLHLDTALG